jgi:hypothetical protein
MTSESNQESKTLDVEKENFSDCETLLRISCWADSCGNIYTQDGNMLVKAEHLDDILYKIKQITHRLQKLEEKVEDNSSGKIENE